MEIYEYGDHETDIILIQPVDEHDMQGMENEFRYIRDNVTCDFKMIAVKIENWNKDLSPWNAPAVFGKENFGSGAEDTLQEIEKLCGDTSKTYYLGGYSLAGLFALWVHIRMIFLQQWWRHRRQSGFRVLSNICEAMK